MEPEIQKKTLKFSRKKLLLYSLLTLIVLSLIFTVYSTYNVLSYDKVYKGVSINGINVDGMSLDELNKLLGKKYQDKITETELVLEYKNKAEKARFSDLNVNYDISGTADKAYSIGRTGNIFNRLSEIVNSGKKGKKFDIIYSFDKKKVDNLIDKLHEDTLIKVKEADLLIQENKVTIRSGHHGENIDRDKVYKMVENTIELCKSEPVEAPIIITAQSKINVDDYYKRITVAAADAGFKTNGKTYELTSHVNGRSIDKDALISITNELEKTEDTEKVLPVIFTKPKVTMDKLYSNLFKDTLSEFHTQFNTGNKNNANRGVNIRLAVSKINGTILAPGDVFSFNNIVGERTEEGGYQAAHTYVGGKVVDGIGGGICQVSTTLYNAVLFSDLNVLERSNHYFTVAYVPLGRDAAVSYGDVDFKFKNSTKWPIKIKGWVTDDNMIYFTLYGTNETPGKEIIINPKFVKTLNFPTVYTNNPKMNAGAQVVTQYGSDGCIIDTYKVVKLNGKVVSESKINTSYYHPMTQQVTRGTKNSIAATPAPSKTKQPSKP